MVISIAISASIITIGSLVLFRLAEHRGLDVARTVTLVSMVMFQMWTAIAVRSTVHPMSKIGWFTNKKLLLAILVGIALVIPLVYVPFLQKIFGTAALNLADWAEILAVSSLGLIVVEIWELINRKWFKFGV
jgi:Ca2+-transporting ATPase